MDVPFFGTCVLCWIYGDRVVEQKTGSALAFAQPWHLTIKPWRPHGSEILVSRGWKIQHGGPLGNPPKSKWRCWWENHRYFRRRSGIWVPESISDGTTRKLGISWQVMVAANFRDVHRDKDWFTELYTNSFGSKVGWLDLQFFLLDYRPQIPSPFFRNDTSVRFVWCTLPNFFVGYKRVDSKTSLP